MIETKEKDNRYYGPQVYQVLGRSIYDNQRKAPDGGGLFICNVHTYNPWYALEHAEDVIRRDKMQKMMDRHEIVTLYVKDYLDVAWCAYIPPEEEDANQHLGYQEDEEMSGVRNGADVPTETD